MNVRDAISHAAILLGRDVGGAISFLEYEIEQAFLSGRKKDAVLLCRHAGTILDGKGLQRSAIRLFERVRSECPNDPTIHLLLGNVYEQENRLGEARDAYVQAQRLLEPLESDLAGVVVIALERVDEAERDS